MDWSDAVVCCAFFGFLIFLIWSYKGISYDDSSSTPYFVPKKSTMPESTMPFWEHSGPAYSDTVFILQHCGNYQEDRHNTFRAFSIYSTRKALNDDIEDAKLRVAAARNRPWSTEYDRFMVEVMDVRK